MRRRRSERKSGERQEYRLTRQITHAHTRAVLFPIFWYLVLNVVFRVLEISDTLISLKNTLVFIVLLILLYLFDEKSLIRNYFELMTCFRDPLQKMPPNLTKRHKIQYILYILF